MNSRTDASPFMQFWSAADFALRTVGKPTWGFAEARDRYATYRERMLAEAIDRVRKVGTPTRLHGVG